jgi:hypothetical protein
MMISPIGNKFHEFIYRIKSKYACLINYQLMMGF